MAHYRLEIYNDGDGAYRWRLWNPNGRQVTGSRAYATGEALMGELGEIVHLHPNGCAGSLACGRCLDVDDQTGEGVQL